MMRIGLISSYPTNTETSAASHDDLLMLYYYALALAQHGLQVLWLSSTDTAEALPDNAALVRDEVQSMPATCRYVIPCQPYHLAGIQLFCTDRTLWQQRPMHTRLFTFLCLLQRQLPCAVFHAWGDLSAAFMTVYSARFLGLPAVVSYSRSCLRTGPQHPFEWQWVARHTSMAFVTNHTDQERLLATSEYLPTQVRVSHPAVPQTMSTMVALYQRLQNSKTL